MLVPQFRLLWLTAITVVPLLAMAGMETPGAPLCAAVAVAVGLLIILDALRAWPLLDGVAVVLPSVVRWVKDRPAELSIQIRSGNAAGSPSGLRPHCRMPCRVRKVSVA